jgi:hypothetical protein
MNINRDKTYICNCWDQKLEWNFSFPDDLEAEDKMRIINSVLMI